MEARVAGESYAVCNVEGGLYALGGTCPHAGGPLGEGQIEGGTLICPWHAWEYDCRTGVNGFDEDVVLPTYAVRVDGDDILIEVPAVVDARTA
jgi:nitrite reductase/ring-hydroxylating ferredoxin subunit